MKQITVYIALVMMLANAYTASASALCLSDSNSEQVSVAMANVTDMSLAADMPCHEQISSQIQNQSQSPIPGQSQSQIEPAGHCEGHCSCPHASVQQTPVLAESGGFSFNESRAYVAPFFQEDWKSLSILPPRRPPKFTS